MPQLILIDGGPEQLKFAQKSLKKLDLSILIVSLAKREELIFTSESPDPVRLDRNDSGLLLLQRVRDESHRYAITTHRKKRQSRLKRSALEEIPGIGKHMSALLLARFGSVQQIARLSLEELMKSPGMGKNRAEKIIEYLQGEKYD